jgi:Uma2 family endonuclease
MSLSSRTAVEPSAGLVVLDEDIPVLYEDEEEDMGEANLHAWANVILFGCLPSLMSQRQPEYQAFANLNCYYEVKGRRSPKTGRKPNFASDIMIVRPYKLLPLDTTSYTIGEHGPEPFTVIEVASKETAAQRDFTEKLVLYRKLKIKEYILVDLTARFLPEKLQLKRLQANGKWKNVMDDDGGLTSQLGFRLIIDETDMFGLFVVDCLTGKRRVRSHESEDYAVALRLAEARENALEESRRAEAESRRLAEEQVKALQAEVECLRSNLKQES